ncbi:hypothetical protein P3S68_014947 [Capsicum galapagoense]
MDRTPIRGSTFLGGCDFPSVLETIYEERKGKCKVLEDELTKLIKRLFKWKGGPYVEKLLLNEHDPSTKSFNIYQKLVHEYRLARSLRRDTNAIETQHSGGANLVDTSDVASGTKPIKRPCSKVLLL